MSDEEFEFRQHWTHVAGQVAAYQGIIATIRAEAGTAFTQDKDAVAHYAKDLAKRLEVQLKPLEEELDKCIKRGSKLKPRR